MTFVIAYKETRSSNRALYASVAQEQGNAVRVLPLHKSIKRSRNSQEIQKTDDFTAERVEE